MTSASSNDMTTLQAQPQGSLRRFARMRLFAEPLSSLVYRLYTLIDTAGFLLITAKQMQQTSFVTVGTAGFFSMLAKLVAGMVVPAYLMWRNVSTYRRREPMLTRNLLKTGPWYFHIAVMLVWAVITIDPPVLSAITLPFERRAWQRISNRIPNSE